RYDEVGRMVERQEREGTSRWSYDTRPRGVGKLAEVTGSDGYKESYDYDTIGRLASKTTVIQGSSYVQRTEYDANGRISALIYPSGFKARNVYNSLGYLVEVRDDNNVAFWKLDSSNARGQTVREQFGNGIATNYTYDTMGHLHSTQSGNAAAPKPIHAASFEFDQIGNLTKRSNDIQNLNEQFTYDNLNRLVNSTINGQLRLTMEYDALGNIKRKSDVGNYTYGERGAGVHAVTSISGLRNQSYEYDANGNRTKHNGGDIVYTSYNMPARLREGNTEMVFLHSPDHARYLKTVGNSGMVTTTHYVGGLYETETANGVTTQRHYLSNGSTFAVYTTQTSKPAQTRYLHKDHLGSTEAISDDNSAVAESLSFDAWGARRDPSTWASTTGLGRNSSNRGFTGHEPLDELGLVHMNGRVYDPLIGRFISADPFIQFEDNSQSLNRYSYVLNGPLSSIDPDGFSIWKKIGMYYKLTIIIAIGIATGGSAFVAGLAAGASAFFGTAIAGAMVTGFITGFATSLTSGLLFGQSLSKSLRSAFAGGISGALTGGISKYYGSSYPFSRVIANSVSGGVSSVIQGGKFWDGFKFNFAISMLSYSNMMMRKWCVQQSKIDQRVRTQNELSSDPLSNDPKIQLVDGKPRTVNDGTGLSVGLFGSEEKIGGGRYLAGSKEESLLGGMQNQPGKIMGMSYQKGSIVDYVVEAYAGPHDTFNSPWFYQFTGPYAGSQRPDNPWMVKTLGEIFNYSVNVTLATPFAAGALIDQSNVMYQARQAYNHINK
ncbi:MAG: RHS repeat-associated core domain-containing protein, partial [Chloroflexota bacterium]